MNKIFYIIFICVFVCCNKNLPQNLWDNVEILRSEGDLTQAIINLEKIINKYPKHKLAAESQYLLAEIYLNDIKNFDIAIEHYQKTIKNYSNSRIAKNSLFMLGYVYNNFLTSYTDAIDSYRSFLIKYPNDELTPSVRYELESLSKIEKTIDSLNSIVVKKEMF